MRCPKCEDDGKLDCECLPPEIDFCGACNEHAGWLYEDGEWLSACCSARPVEVDPT